MESLNILPSENTKTENNVGIEKSSSSACRILSQEKCKVSELLFLCKEDPDSVMNIYKTKTGDGRCLPKIELDTDTIHYFEQKFKSEECILKYEPVEFGVIKDIFNKSIDQNQSECSLEHGDSIQEILKTQKIWNQKEYSSSYETEMEVDRENSLLKSKPSDQDDISTKNVEQILSVSSDSKKNIESRKKSVTITECVNILSLLPKVHSPLLQTGNNCRRQQKTKLNKMIWKALPPERPRPIISQTGESQAVVMLRQVIKEHKIRLRLEEKECKECTCNETIEEQIRKSRKTSKWKNFLSHLRQKPTEENKL